MVKNIEENKELSSSFLEKLKKQIYNGERQYKLCLDMNKEEKGALRKLMEKAFKDSDNKDNNFYSYMLYYNGKSLIYILNDVLEALSFMAKGGSQ
ncbi:MAG TPA: hypothetical protein DC034_08295 [Clostridium sp.]|nr:hypothetical protein [Clostridium sp.]